MDLYIPQHLRRIKLLEHLIVLLQDYRRKEEVESFDKYREILKTDPVKRFLDLVLFLNEKREIEDVENRISEGENVSTEEKERIEEIKQWRRNCINYITTLFYSVKGTFKVIHFIIDYKVLDLDYISDEDRGIDYTVSKIEIRLRSIPPNMDDELFCKSLEEFLCALLYFGTFHLEINNVITEINDNTTSSIDKGNILFYQKYNL